MSIIASCLSWLHAGCFTLPQANLKVQQRTNNMVHGCRVTADLCSIFRRLPFSFINKEVAKATCLCLLEEASHALMVRG